MGFLRSVALWSTLAFPFSPSVFGLFHFGHRCFGPSPPELHSNIGFCLGSIVTLSPWFVLLGGSPLDDGTPDQNFWPSVFAIAAIVGLAVAGTRWAIGRKWRRPSFEFTSAPARFGEWRLSGRSETQDRFARPELWAAPNAPDRRYGRQRGRTRDL